jgi:hypothetical protein
MKKLSDEGFQDDHDYHFKFQSTYCLAGTTYTTSPSDNANLPMM